MNKDAVESLKFGQKICFFGESGSKIECFFDSLVGDEQICVTKRLEDPADPSYMSNPIFILSAEEVWTCELPNKSLERDFRILLKEKLLTKEELRSHLSIHYGMYWESALDLVEELDAPSDGLVIGEFCRKKDNRGFQTTYKIIDLSEQEASLRIVGGDPKWPFCVAPRSMLEPFNLPQKAASQEY